MLSLFLGFVCCVISIIEYNNKYNFGPAAGGKETITHTKAEQMSMPSSSSSALKDAKRITASLRSARLQMEASVLSMGDASELVQEDSKYYRGSFYEIHHPLPYIFMNTQ